MPIPEINMSGMMVYYKTLGKAWIAQNKPMHCHFKSEQGKTALLLNIESPQSFYNSDDNINMSFDFPSMTVSPELAKKIVDALNFDKIKAEWNKKLAAEKQGNDLFN